MVLPSMHVYGAVVPSQQVTHMCDAPTLHDVDEAVSTGTTGYAEAVEITYDPSIVTADSLFKVFFTIHDPTTMNRQGNDVGTQYRAAVWTSDETQRRAFDRQRHAHAQHHAADIVTTVSSLHKAVFHPAEAYHQQYLQKGGQSATKGDNTPVQCYGSRGPIKSLDQPGLRDILSGRPDRESAADL